MAEEETSGPDLIDISGDTSSPPVQLRKRDNPISFCYEIQWARPTNIPFILKYDIINDNIPINEDKVCYWQSWFIQHI